MNDEPSKIDISDETAQNRRSTGKMPVDMPEWMANTITTIDKFSKKVGSVVCWILMPLIFAMTYEAVSYTHLTLPTRS